MGHRSSNALGGWHMRCEGREHGDNLTSPMEFQNELVFTSYKAFASGSARGCFGAHCRDARLRGRCWRGVRVRARRRRSRRRFTRAHRGLRSPDRPLSLWGARVPIRTRLPGLAYGPWLLGRASGLGLAGRPRLRWGPRIRRGSPRLRRRWPRGLRWRGSRWRRPRGSRSLIAEIGAHGPPDNTTYKVGIAAPAAEPCSSCSHPGLSAKYLFNPGTVLARSRVPRGERTRTERLGVEV